MKAKIAGLFVLGILFSFQVLAHSPIGIEMDADIADNRIFIAVNHPAGSPHSHYVRTIEVIADGQAPIIKIFRFQKANHQRTSVDLPGLDAIGRIVIKAYCNKGGFLSKEFNMEKLRTAGQDPQYIKKRKQQ